MAEQSLYVPPKKDIVVPVQEELTAEELEHIKRVSEMTEQSLYVPPKKDIVVPVQEELTAEELDQTYQTFDHEDSFVEKEEEVDNDTQSENSTCEDFESNILETYDPSPEGSFSGESDLAESFNETNALYASINQEAKNSADSLSESIGNVSNHMGKPILSIDDMRYDENLQQWYNEQISFMRRTLDEEDDEQFSTQISTDNYGGVEQDTSSIVFHSPEKAEKDASDFMRRPAIDRTSASMFSNAKTGRFAFSSFGKFASDAIDKAKHVGEQLQTAASTSLATQGLSDVSQQRTPSREQLGFDNLSDVERGPTTTAMRPTVVDHSYQIPSTSRTVLESEIPPGMEDLTYEERQKILSVMAEAERMTPSPQPPRMQSKSPVPPGMEDLTEEEREKIMAVMSEAERMTPTPQPTRERKQQSEPPIPPGMEDLTAEEREKIMAVMAAADREIPTGIASVTHSLEPSRSVSRTSLRSDQFIPPGMEDLTEEERNKIMAVMAEAEQQTRFIPSPMPSRSPSVHVSHVPEVLPLDGLTQEERDKIASVVREAEREMGVSPAFARSPIPAEVPRQFSPMPPRIQDTSRIEREQPTKLVVEEEKPTQVMVEEIPISQRIEPSRSDDFARFVVDSNDIEMTESEEEETKEETEINEQYERPSATETAESVWSRDTAPSMSRTFQLPTKITDTGIDDDLMEEMNEEPKEMINSYSRDRYSGVRTSSRQHSMTSSISGSPTRESGYGTSSSSYEKQLGDYAAHTAEDSGYLLEDSCEIREGAQSRNGSHADAKEDPFTYKDDRFSDITQSIENQFYDVTVHDEKGVNVDAVELKEDLWKDEEVSEKSWVVSRPRMWTTVFEGDESEVPDDVFMNSGDDKSTAGKGFGGSGLPRRALASISSPEDAIEMDDISESFSTVSAAPLKEIEFDSTPQRTVKKQEPVVSSAMTWTPMGVVDKTPEIRITVHDDRRSDSEEEESASDDDDEYPDKVVSAPVAPLPSFEELEKEREQQEQFGKQVLQQIQAFGEAADDEFDVKWALSTLERERKKEEEKSQMRETAVKRLEEMEFSTQKKEEPLELDISNTRRNPFIQSPDEEDVSIDMEELEFSNAAKFYASPQSLASHRPGPVYTIPEDESEDDVTATDSESRMIAKERKRMKAQSVVNSVINMHSEHPASTIPVQPVKVPVTTSTVSTTAYAIVSFAPTSESDTSSSSIYNSSYLFSTTPFILPQYSPHVYTSTSMGTATPMTVASSMAPVSYKKGDDPIVTSIHSKIDKTLNDIHNLLDSCAVYTCEASKPNLLCFDDSAFRLPTTLVEPVTTVPIPSSCLLAPVQSSGIMTSSGGDVTTSPSPSFLLPLSSTLGSSLVDNVQSPRGLRRSPGMMISADFPGEEHQQQKLELDSSSSSPAKIAMNQLETQFNWITEKQDNGLGNGDMGRRKLPSIPSHSSYTTKQTYPPPAPGIYKTPEFQLSDCRLYSTSASTSTIHTAGTQTLAGQQGNGYLPSSVRSSSLSSLPHGAEPSIMPGVAFNVKPKVAMRTPVSVVVSRKTTPPTARIPNTLARVLLKKELKETLERRKEQLDATEIEASQRQYMIKQMFLTGLLPERPQDDTPKTIRCELPEELIRGVKINYNPPSTSGASLERRFDLRRTIREQQQAPKPPPHTQKSSIGVQSEGFPEQREQLRDVREVSRRMTYAGSSLRQQIHTESRNRMVESETQTDRTTETTVERDPVTVPRRQQEYRFETHTHSAQTSDLLEATKKYFEDYDRQLKELTAKVKKNHAKKKFEFHEDDMLTREQRRLELVDELSRRREQIWADRPLASDNLPYRTPIFPMSTSDYSSVVPHYGSLPRIDYPSRGRQTVSRDFTYKQPNQQQQQQQPNYAYNYGSLPRNYERCLAPSSGIQIDYEQSFGDRAYAPMTSRSMYDLHSDNVIDRRFYPQEYGRSMDYLEQTGASDRLLTAYPSRPQQQQYGMDYRTAEYRNPLGANQAYSQEYRNPLGVNQAYSQDYRNPVGTDRTYSQDTTNLIHTQPQEMISQYANYLNNQFQSGVFAADRYSANVPQAQYPRYPSQIVSGPLSDPHHNLRQSYNVPQQPHYPTQQQYSVAAPMSDPLHYQDSYDISQVYSRNELNYGSRPLQYSMDYGNMERNRLSQQQQMLPPTVPIPNAFVSRYPEDQREDALSRIYATVGQRRTATRDKENVQFYSIPRNQVQADKKSRDIMTLSSSVNILPSSNVKRILLTRRYKDHNVFNDLGVRIVGGKRLPNGDLAAFVSNISLIGTNKTLGELKEGDQVLEWNGVLLNGKTFEEVERIVNSSNGEVELIVKSEPEAPTRRTIPSERFTTTDRNAVLPQKHLTFNKNTRAKELSPERSPPVPIHKRCNSNRIYDSVGGHGEDRKRIKTQDNSSFGYLQVAMSYDRSKSMLHINILAARGLKMRDTRCPPNPFVKVYLLPGRKVSHKRRTRFVPNSADPEWHQQVSYDIPSTALYSHFIEFSLWDYDKFSENNALGQVLIPLSEPTALSGVARWWPIEAIDSVHLRSHINAPIERHMNISNGNYNPTSLDIGYPAIN